MTGYKVMGRAFVLSLLWLLLAASTALAWYPYSERYEEWQKGRPVTMGVTCSP